MVGLSSERRGAALIDAVRRHAEAAQSIPLVLDSPHSGTAYPADFDHAAPRSLVRRAEDTMSVCPAPRFGAIDQHCSRALTSDPNWYVADIDTGSPTPGPGDAVAQNRAGSGCLAPRTAVCRCTHADSARPGVRQRIERYYDPSCRRRRGTRRAASRVRVFGI
jgi:N-formylglutamate deformylase